MSEKPIRSGLISVFHKDGLAPIITRLNEIGVRLFATGGTQEFIEGLKIPVTAVESVTDYPSILGGRVKTLHPKIFGGILSRRENSSDTLEMDEFKIPEIDLVVVDLYPFEKTVSSGASDEDIIEKIDIGGISLIRAAAKNFNDVLIIPSVTDYDFLLGILNEKKGKSSLEDRKRMSARAFAVSSSYDSAICDYFNRQLGVPYLQKSLAEHQVLRYGENPHQKGIFFGNLDDLFTKVHGKELSYNNLLDIEAAIQLIAEFTEPTVAILKHNNACGVASRPVLKQAWEDALKADPVSAFGGILITNAKLDVETAESMNALFFEVLIAPEFQSGALEILQQKKNRILLIQKKTELPAKQFRSLLNGIAEQDRDQRTESVSDMRTVSKLAPTPSQLKDLEFANKVAKHTKSNTIVLAKDMMLLASGTGQTSRVDALRQAIDKAKKFGFSLEGAVMASDAFFPFPDCVLIAAGSGIKAIIQPGGSIKDQEPIDASDKFNIAMVMTGVRHFRH